MNEIDFAELEKEIGIQFANKSLLRQAFIHRSYLNEHRRSGLEHNERLEFLGDAVLELVVTDFLFRTYPDKAEGDLTAYRSALVNTTTLSGAALTLGIGNYLLLSRGEAKDVGRARQYILANAFEALIGAIYLDQGYDSAKGFIGKTIIPLIGEIVEKRLWQDPKSRFQEMAQEEENVTPTYTTIREQGPDHDKNFVVGVFLRGTCIAEGEGRSKQEAEQAAAKRGLEVKGW